MELTFINEDGKRRLKPFAAVSLGVVVSIVGPILFFFFYMETYYDGMIAPKEMFQIMSGSSLMTKMIFLSMTPNYFLLFLCAKKEWMYMLYGIFIPTVLIAILSFIVL